MPQYFITKYEASIYLTKNASNFYNIEHLKRINLHLK